MIYSKDIRNSPFSPGRLFPHRWDNMLRIVADIIKIEVHMYRKHIKLLTRNILSYVLVENKFCVIACPIPYPIVDNFPWRGICSFANDISNSSNIPAISPLCTYRFYYCLWNTNVIWRKMTMLTHYLTGQTLKICVVVICLTGKVLRSNENPICRRWHENTQNHANFLLGRLMCVYVSQF